MRKIVTTFALIAALIAASAVGISLPRAARADETPFFAEYDGTSYYGFPITASTAGEFSFEFDPADADLDTPLVEFIVTPDHRGSGTQDQRWHEQGYYTPDMESMTMTFTETETTNALTLQFGARTDSGQGQISIMAAGTGQRQFSTRFERDDNTYMSSDGVFGALVASAYDGYLIDDRYPDETGNPVPVGSHRPVKLYYSAETNALYADSSFLGKHIDPELDDVYKTGNKRRYLVRDFDVESFYSWDGSVQLSDSAWGGFNEGSTVRMTVSLGDAIAGREPSIIVLSVAGKPLVDDLMVPALPSMGVAGVAYPVPEPFWFDRDTASNKPFAGSGTFAVLGPDGEEFSAAATYTSGATFTPDSAGEYTIKYSVEGNNAEAKLNVLPAGATGTVLSLSAGDGDNYLYDTLEVFAAATNGLQTAVPDVTLTVKRDGEVYEGDVRYENVTVTGPIEFAFDETGVFEFEFASVDYLRRTTTAKFTRTVIGYYAYFGDGISSGMLYDSYDEVPAPAATDIRFYDIATDAYVNATSVTIEASYEDENEFAAVDGSTFLRSGKYVVRYTATYGDGLTAVASRNIYVMSGAVPSIAINALPRNVRVELNASDRVLLRAVTSGSVTFPYGMFSATLGELDVELEHNGETTDVTEAFSLGDYVLRVTEPGIYRIMAVAVNDVYRTVFPVEVDIRAKWYEEAAPVENKTISLGKTYDDLAPAMVDYFGNPAPVKATVAVTLEGTPVTLADGKLVADKVGIYTVAYSFTDSGETVSGSYTLTCVDDSAPVIDLGKFKTKGRTGKFVKLAEAKVTDATGELVLPAVTVEKEGTQIITYDGGFTADEAGTYKVTVTATDRAGNVSTETYEVRVRTWTDVIVGCVLAGVAAIAIVVTVVLLVLRKKKNRS